jgi:hypothetical protein
MLATDCNGTSQPKHLATWVRPSRKNMSDQRINKADYSIAPQEICFTEHDGKNKKTQIKKAHIACGPFNN